MDRDYQSLVYNQIVAFVRNIDDAANRMVNLYSYFQKKKIKAIVLMNTELDEDTKKKICLQLGVD